MWCQNSFQLFGGLVLRIFFQPILHLTAISYALLLIAEITIIIPTVPPLISLSRLSV